MRHKWHALGAAVTLAACASSNHMMVDRNSAGAPLIALRLASSDSAAGRERALYGDAVLYLESGAVISDDDFVSVTADAAGPSVLLRARCRPEACERLVAATGANVGGTLAVLIDARVRAAAPIASAIGRGGSMTIAIDAAGADAERILSLVRARWPAP